MKNKLTIAVVGCGHQGRNHIQHLCSNPAVERVIAVDIDDERLRQVTEKHGVETAKDINCALEYSALDAVVVSTSNTSHLPIVLAAFTAGKDVLCEKPLSPTLVECRKMVEMSRKHKRILHCHFELRHSAVPLRLKAIIDSGEIGELRSLNMIHYRGAFRPAWKADPTKSGGLALMETCHTIDLFRYLAGHQVQEVQSFAPPSTIPYYGYADTEYLLMKMERGTICHLTTCHTRSSDEEGEKPNDAEWEEKKYGHQYEYNILGSKGAIWYDAVRRTGLFIYHHVGEEENWHCRLARVEDFSHVPYAQQMHGSDVSTFVLAVRERRDTHITPEDALRTHEICFAVEQSRQKGAQPIKLVRR